MQAEVTPEQIAKLIKTATGMTLKDLYIDGDVDHGDWSDRIKQLYLSGPTILLDAANADSDELTNWLLITTPEMNVEGEGFWREVFALLDTVEENPVVPQIHGDMTLNEYRAAVKEDVR